MTVEKIKNFFIPEQQPPNQLFNYRMNGILGHFEAWEQTCANIAPGLEKDGLITNLFQEIRNDPELGFPIADDRKKRRSLIDKLSSSRARIKEAETEIFNNLFELFSLKQNLVEGSEDGVEVAMLGALGAGKTTLIDRLSLLLEGQGKKVIYTKEPHLDNPVWRLSQKDRAFMGMSQWWFFLANMLFHLNNSVQTNNNDEKFRISDTHVITDIEMWAPWYHRIGDFPSQDFVTYQRLVNFFKPIIPKPKLLVILGPSFNNDLTLYTDNLMQGVTNRLKHEKARRQEKKFCQDPKYLTKQVEIVLELVKSIPQTWGIPILHLVADPLELYNSPQLQTQCTDQIIDAVTKLPSL